MNRPDPVAEQQQRVQRLLNPEAFPHAAGDLQLIETHISWVILAGDYAYKIKKPLNLGFLDYSSLDRRRHFCEEEIRLNRRTAPGTYLDVATISGTTEHPCINGGGPALDYAVRMRRFGQQQLLSAQLEAGTLTEAHIDALVLTVAAFHQAAAVAPAAGKPGTPELVHHPVRENFSQTLARIEDGAERRRLETLAAWAEQQYSTLHDTLAARLRDGFVRECHGDLHLGNIILVDGQPQPFDGIEFSEPLRWIDVMSDCAFLVMDLAERGRPELAWRFLNGYLERSGDYAGLRLLGYYLAYRAMVRAKVAAIRIGQTADNAARQSEGWRDYRNYVALAEGYTRRRNPCLLITCGLSGSGKSHGSRALLARHGIIRLRSDVERKRLFGLAPEAASGSTPGGGIYTPQASAQTYAHLAALAEAVIAAGYPVLVDATFLSRAQRTPFRQLAARLQIPFAILHYHASEATLRRRVAHRQRKGHDASEAGTAILERQLAGQEPPQGDELACTLRIDTEQDTDPALLDQRLAQQLGMATLS